MFIDWCEMKRKQAKNICLLGRVRCTCMCVYVRLWAWFIFLLFHLLACHIQICSLEPIIFCCGKSRKSFHHPGTCFSSCWPGNSLRLWLPQLPYEHLPQFCKQALYGADVCGFAWAAQFGRSMVRSKAHFPACMLTLHCWRVHRSIWLLGFWHCVY